jgi:5-methylcytosine-specific restriction endonuclease McrA
MLIDHPLHQEAIQLAQEFTRVESKLVDVIQRIDREKLFRQMGFASLFEYVNKGLKLSESVAYGLITVARKSVEVPELKIAIEQGELSLSQAKRVTSVITNRNAGELIEKAKTLTQKQLEKEVAKINPKIATPERTRYVNEERVEIRVCVSEAVMKKIKRAQNLESQRTRSACDLEMTLEAIVDLYLEKRDPVKKAQRILNKAALNKTQQTLNHVTSNKTQEALNHGTSNKTREALNHGTLQETQPVLSHVVLDKTGQLAKKPSLSRVTERSPSSRRVADRLHPLSRATRRSTIPKAIQHQVHKRDEGQCTFIDSQGQRCSSQRWTQIHHITEMQFGGDHSLDNLVTLCFAHHRHVHIDGIKAPGHEARAELF